MSDIPEWAQAARDSWQWRGSGRPSFAVVPGPSQVSVWDFPRPPKVAFDTREVVVRWGDIEVVRTSRAVLVLEKLPPANFLLALVRCRPAPAPAGGRRICLRMEGASEILDAGRGITPPFQSRLELPGPDAWRGADIRLRRVLR